MGFKLGTAIIVAGFVVITIVATVVFRTDDAEKKGLNLAPIHNTDAGQNNRDKGFQHSPVQNTGRDKGY